MWIWRVTAQYLLLLWHQIVWIAQKSVGLWKIVRNTWLISISSISFRRIYREVNDVANHLAHLASRSYIDDLWLGETPSIIDDVLYEDICKCTRGLGTTSLA